MNQAMDPVALVRRAWPNQVRVIGEGRFREIGADPARALASAGSGGADDALRFDTKMAVETICAALSIAKLAIEAWKAWRTANRAIIAADLDAFIRSKVKGQPVEEALLRSKEYTALLEKVSAS